MFRSPSFRIFYLIVALTLFAASSQALPVFHHGREVPRTSQVEKESGGFFAFLLRLFGKSGGGMDPNGGYSGPGAE
jgi:hypothetical protein